MIVIDKDDTPLNIIGCNSHSHFFAQCCKNCVLVRYLSDSRVAVSYHDQKLLHAQFAANKTSLQASMTALILTGILLLVAVSLPLTCAFPRQLLLPFGKENGDTPLLNDRSQPILELPGARILYVS